MGSSSSKNDEVEKKKIEQQKQVMEKIEKNNNELKQMLKKQSDQLDEESEKEEKRRIEIEEEMTREMTELMDQRQNILLGIVSENNKELEELETIAISQREEETTRQIEERTELKNQLDKMNDECENVRTNLKQCLENKIEEQRNQITAEIQKMADDTLEMAATLTKNEETRRREKNEMERKRDELILSKNQLELDSDIRLHTFNENCLKLELAFANREQKAKELRAKIKDLENVRNDSLSIKSNIDEIFDKIDIPMKGKNVEMLRRNSIFAKIKIKIIEQLMNNIRSDLPKLKDGVQNIDENSEKRKKLAEETERCLTHLESHLTRLRTFISDKENLKLENFEELTKCLKVSVVETDRIVATLREIPDYPRQEDFANNLEDQLASLYGHDCIE